MIQTVKDLHMNTYPFAGEIKMTKVVKDGKEVVEWQRVYLTYHGDGNVGIGTPPDASAPLATGEPVEHLRVSLSDGAIWNKAIAQERKAVFDVLEDLLGYSGVGTDGNPYDTPSWNAALKAAQQVLLERTHGTV